MQFASFIIAAFSLFAVLSGTPSAAADLSDSEVLNNLAQAVDDDRRGDLIIELQNRSTKDVRVVLENILGDDHESSMIRMQAVCALAGSATPESVPVLLATVEQDLTARHGFWACAIPLLGDLGDRRAVPLLRQVADLNQGNLAGMDHMAISALAQMATGNEISFLEGKAHIYPVRADVMRALSRIAAPASAEVLVSGLQDGEDAEIVEAATAGLIKIGVPALPALQAGLENQPDEVMKTRISTVMDALAQ